MFHSFWGPFKWLTIKIIIIIKSILDQFLNRVNMDVTDQKVDQ